MAVRSQRERWLPCCGEATVPFEEVFVINPAPHAWRR
jgi:hypothetical protein